MATRIKHKDMSLRRRVWFNLAGLLWFVSAGAIFAGAYVMIWDDFWFALKVILTGVVSLTLFSGLLWLVSTKEDD